MIKESIRSIPDGQIKKLRISLMENLAMTKIIQSAENRVNQDLVVQLYRGSQSAYRLDWVSFYNQLDEFYEACLLNKIENESVRYFHARKMTVNECINSTKSYESKEESRILRHQNYTLKQYRKKLKKTESNKLDLDPNWTREDLLKDQNESYELFLGTTKAFSGIKIESVKQHSAQLSEFLDHQLFHGRRMTIEFTCNNNISITEQLDIIMQNNWSRENLVAEQRKTLGIYKDLTKRMRQHIIYDIQQQFPFILRNSIH